MELLFQIFEVCIIPLLGVLTAYFVKWVNAKSNEIQIKVDNDLADKYIAMLDKTITDCVIATNQTYVEALKKEGKFDVEAQTKAFEETKNAVLAILSDEAKSYLTSIVGDLQLYMNRLHQKLQAEQFASSQQVWNAWFHLPW